MRKRTFSRESALKILYQAEITRRKISDATSIYWETAENIDAVVKEFSEKLLNGI